MISARPRTQFLLALFVLAARPHAAPAQTTGLVPLTDLGPGVYAGYQGGLYPGGANAPPGSHLDAALLAAAGVVPRNVAGNPDPNGWIAMIAVGMSNTTHEFGAFERNADRDTSRNARIVLLDTGLGGQTATLIANPAAGYWNTLTQRLAGMGLTPAQVQVAWLKEAESHPQNNFPLHAQALRDTLKQVANNLHSKFPNLKLCYVSSRIYGGYSEQGTLNPEPQAYESGFAVKWLIEDQIGGDPRLNFDPRVGDVRAPLLLWGPYLWADGVNPRSDGLVWLVTDFEGDHVHPSPSGEQKVAGLLADCFASETTAAAWWPALPGVRLATVDATDDAHVSAASPGSNFGADTLLLEQGGALPLNVYLRFDASAVTRPLLLAKLSLRVFQGGGGGVRIVDDTSWDQGTLTFANAPPIGSALVSMPQSSRDGTIGANVTEAVRSDPDHRLSFALTTPSAGQASYHSKEGGDPPRLVLVVSTATTSVSSVARPFTGLRSVIPNPADRGARVSFELSVPGAVDLAVYGVDGRRVRTLVHGPWPAGRHDAWWDGRDERGAQTSPGLYLVRLTAGAKSETGKLVRIP